MKAKKERARSRRTNRSVDAAGNGDAAEIADAQAPALPERNLSRGLGLGLALLVGAVYLQVRTHAFVDYDTTLYLSQNAMVLRGLTREGFAWAWTTFHAANWHPVTWLSHMLDVELYRLEPAGHNLTNVAFHIANTLLVYALLVRWTGAVWRSALVGALFGLHPMHVESVAWIVERKDVLSAFFGLAFLHAWTSWLRAPGVGRYALAFVLFALGLAAKPMIITLPCVLLLADVWPLRRTDVPLSRRLLEKLPLLVLMIASAELTRAAQAAGGAMSSMALTPRLANALWAWPTYVSKLVWPLELMPFYAWRDRSGDGGAIALCVAVIVALTIVAWCVRRAAPYALVGWLWFLGMLVPVIGLIQVGEQSMADRYTYLPSIGLFVALVWGAVELLERGRVPREIRGAIGLALAAVLSFLCAKQVSRWESTHTIAEHALSIDSSSGKMHGLLGICLAEDARRAPTPEAAAELYRLAEHECRESVRLSPNSADEIDRLGFVLAVQGRLPEAQELFERVLTIDPQNSQAMNHLGGVYDALDRVPEAEAWMRKSLAANPDNVQAMQNLGWLLERQGKLADAERQFRRAIAAQPRYARAEWRLGVVCRKQQRYDEATQWLALALAHGLMPNDASDAEREHALARAELAKKR